MKTPLGRTQNPELANPAEVVYVPYREPGPVLAQSLAQARLQSALRASFEADPLEDGIYHPGRGDHRPGIAVRGMPRRSCMVACPLSGHSPTQLRGLGSALPGPPVRSWVRYMARRSCARSAGNRRCRDSRRRGASGGIVGGLESGRRSGVPFRAGDMASRTISATSLTTSGSKWTSLMPYSGKSRMDSSSFRNMPPIKASSGVSPFRNFERPFHRANA